MERLRDEFFNILMRTVSLEGKSVLEIGCGTGERSVQIAARCAHLVGIDPDKKSIEAAQSRRIPNAEFLCAKIQRTKPIKKSFDVVLFTHSLHHMGTSGDMVQAISRAARMTTPGGYLVFLEPGTEGSFFRAEIDYGACDGDETDAKEAAYLTMQKHPALKLVEEINDYVIFGFKDTADFIESMKPNKKTSKTTLESFLCKHNHFLKACVRINIYQLRS